MKLSLAIGAGALALGLALGAKAVNSYWETKWANAELAKAKAQVDAVDKALETYRDQLARLEETNATTKQALADALDAAYRADRANDGLQQQIDNSVRRGSQCSATSSTSERAAAATELVVLADVLRRANNRAGELAKIADEARIRGLACETSYRSI